MNIEKITNRKRGKKLGNSFNDLIENQGTRIPTDRLLLLLRTGR